MTIPIREEPMTIVRADVRKLSRLQSCSYGELSAEETLAASSDVICVSCHSRLNESQSSECSSSNYRRPIKKEKSSICRRMFRFCCKEKCNLIKARVSIIRSPVLYTYIPIISSVDKLPLGQTFIMQRGPSSLVKFLKEIRAFTRLKF